MLNNHRAWLQRLANHPNYNNIPRRDWLQRLEDHPNYAHGASGSRPRPAFNSPFNGMGPQLRKFARKYFTLTPRRRSNQVGEIENDNNTGEPEINAGSASSNTVANIVATTAATTVNTDVVIKASHVMRHRNLRLLTFKDPNWVESANLDKHKLAENGFFYLKHDDAIQCAYCNLVLQQINVFDDVESLHQRYGYKCPLVLNLLQPRVKSSPLSISNVRRRLVFDDSTDAVTQIGGKILNAYDDMASYLLKSEIKLPRYRTMSSRLKTYKTWPHVSQPKPYDMAAAGFYYTGWSDHVRCYSCGMYLNCFDPVDDPWDFHIKWFPLCPHVNVCRSREFISETFSRMLEVNGAYYVKKPRRKCLCTRQNPQTLSDDDELDDDKIYNKDINNCDSSTSSNSDIDKPSTSMLATDDISKKINLCIICDDREMNILYFPCAHLVACEECTTKMVDRTCPICRCFVERIVHVYIGG